MPSTLTAAGWVVRNDIVDERAPLPRLTQAEIDAINAEIAAGSNNYPTGTQVIRISDETVFQKIGVGTSGAFVQMAAGDGVAEAVAAIEAQETASVAAVVAAQATAEGAVDALVTEAEAAQAAAELAAEASFALGPKYTTEALGRAAVADGAVFLVVGSGDVAAYEYRRTNSTTSVLIASYPSAAAVSTAGAAAAYAAKRLAGSFENVTHGLAATTTGQYFAIPNTDTTKLNLYRNDAGVQTLIASAYPASGVLIEYPLSGFEDIKGTLVDNEFVNATTGATSANVSYARTGYIAVYEGQELLYIGSSVGAGGAAYYTAGQVFHSTAIQGSTSGGLETNVCLLTVPAGVAYIRASFKKVNALMFSKAALLAPKGDLARHEVEEVAADLATVTATITETTDLLSGATILTDTAIDVGVTGTTGGTVTVAGYEATGFLPVQVGMTITIAANVRNDVGFAAYDENQVYHSTIYRPSTDGGEITAYSYTVSDPDVAFIRICNRIAGGVTMACEAERIPSVGEVVDRLDNQLNATDAQVKVRFISATEFHVDSRCPDGTYVTHKWVYYDRAAYSDQGWICTEIWHNGQYIVQGNYNVVHMMRDGVSDDDMYVGILHGCETMLWVQFYLDGVEFDPTTDTTTLYGTEFKIQSLSEFYKPDKSESLIVDPAGNFTVAASPEVVRAHRVSEMTIEGNNVIKRHHKLHVKADGVHFDRLFGAMQQTMQAVINGTISFNDRDGTRNYFPGDMDDATAISPSTVVLQGEVYGDRNCFGTIITAEGGDANYRYVVSTRAENADSSQRRKNNVFAYTAYTDRNKFYFQPVITTAVNAAYPDLALDEFDDGDVIEMWSETRIRVSPV